MADVYSCHAILTTPVAHAFVRKRLCARSQPRGHWINKSQSQKGLFSLPAIFHFCLTSIVLFREPLFVTDGFIGWCLYFNATWQTGTASLTFRFLLFDGSMDDVHWWLVMGSNGSQVCSNIDSIKIFFIQRSFCFFCLYTILIR